MQTTKSSKAILAPTGIINVLLAMLASFALVFSFAVPASAAGETVTSVVKTGGGVAAGPLAGGTSITIAGTGFDTVSNPPAATYVKFGTTNAASFTVNSATSITAVSPAGTAGAVSITVGDGVLSSAFTFVAAATVTTVSPTTGPLGGTNTVIITGTNFVGVSGAAAVKFGTNNAASYTVNSTTQITAVAPASSAGAVTVEVVGAGGAVPKASAYTYVSSPPTITSIGTKTGPLTGGTSVVITGTNFHGVVGSSAVKFGANNATSYTVNSPTQITAVAPAGAAGTVNVLVTAVDGTATLGAAYTYRTTSTAVNASERIFFVPGRSEIRSSQYEAIRAIALATEGKSNIRVTLTSRRHSSAPATLGTARITSVKKLLELVGLEGANVTYTRFNTKSSVGLSTADKNNRVTIAVSWTN